MQLSNTISQANSFTQILLFYSRLVSFRYFPDRPARVLTVRVIVAYYSFADVIFDSDARRVEAWDDVQKTFSEHLSLTDSGSFPEMSQALVDALAELEPEILEKRVRGMLEQNLTLRHAGFLSADAATEDPILAAFAAQLSRAIPDSSLREAGAFGASLLLQAEVEPWPETLAKSRYIEFVASMLGLPEVSPMLNDSLPGSHEYSSSVILGESNIRLVFICVSSEADLQTQGERLGGLEIKFELYIFVFVMLGHEEASVAPIRKSLPRVAMMATVFPRDVLRHTLGYETHVLTMSVRSQLPLSVISPYRTSGATGRETFVGRRAELKRVIQTHDIHFAILGPRKIGKTSLLEQLRRTLNGPEAERTIAVAVDAGPYQSLERFLVDLQSEFLASTAAYEWFSFREASQIADTFHELNENLDVVRNNGFQVVFLVDEVDRLLESDDSSKFASCMRALANRNKARFVVFGYTELAESITDGYSPFYNLFSDLPLGPIDQPSAIELATEPMKRIGVAYADETIPNLVARECCNIPWLIQGLCNEMLSHAERGRVISMDVFKRAIDSKKFSDLLLMNIKRDRSLPQLQMLILYIIAESERGCLSELEIANAVDSRVFGVPFKDISNGVAHLLATYRLRETTSGYRFYVERQRTRLLAADQFLGVLQGIADGVSRKYSSR